MSESDCYCDPCKSKRGESHGMSRAAIRSYSYRPANGWRMLMLPNDPFPYCMGVELETSVNFGANPVSDHFAADLRRPKTMWIAKRDGSVTGPEFASHPATLTYWQTKQSDLDEMFRLLLHAGYRSHNGGHAGMHVNISKAAFTDASHLHRFLTFLYVNTAWTLTMSQRTDEQANRWASMRPYRFADAERMVVTGYRSITNKYSVIHAPGSQGRLEFRLPRGTLRVDRFMKNLEWTAAMIAWTRDDDRSMLLHPDDLVRWARSRPLYTDFTNFVAEKAAILDEASSSDSAYRSLRMSDCDYTPQETPIAPTPPSPTRPDVTVNGSRYVWDESHSGYIFVGSV